MGIVCNSPASGSKNSNKLVNRQEEEKSWFIKNEENLGPSAIRNNLLKFPYLTLGRSLI